MLIRTFKDVWPSKAVKFLKYDCGINKRLLTLYFKMVTANVSSIDATPEWIFIVSSHNTKRLVLDLHIPKGDSGPRDILQVYSMFSLIHSIQSNLMVLSQQGKQIFAFQNLHSVCFSVAKWADSLNLIYNYKKWLRFDKIIKVKYCRDALKFWMQKWHNIQVFDQKTQNKTTNTTNLNEKYIPPCLFPELRFDSCSSYYYGATHKTHFECFHFS